MSRDPLPIEMLISDDCRRVSVEDHHAWQKSIISTPPGDDVDELIADIRAANSNGKEKP